MTDLKPCPFCGHNVQIAYDIVNWPHGVWCQCCHIKVGWANIKDKQKDTVGDVEARIAEKWNRRSD